MQAIPHGTTNGYFHFDCRCDECKAAQRSYSAAYYARNAERVRERVLRYHHADKERARTKHRDFRAKNRAYLAAENRRWREENAERYKANRKAWREANAVKKASAHARRAARKRGNATFVITDRDWRRLVARYRSCCAYCGEHRPLGRDHVIPIARGGNDGIGNLLPACTPCNSFKNVRLLVEWRKQGGMT